MTPWSNCLTMIINTCSPRRLLQPAQKNIWLSPFMSTPATTPILTFHSRAGAVYLLTQGSKPGNFASS